MAIVDTFYRDLLESSNEGIVILYAKTDKIPDINPHLTRIPEISKEQILETESGASDLSKRITPDHKIFLEIIKNESVSKKDLPINTT